MQFTLGLYIFMVDRFSALPPHPIYEKDESPMLAMNQVFRFDALIKVKLFVVVLYFNLQIQFDLRGFVFPFHKE